MNRNKYNLYKDLLKHYGVGVMLNDTKLKLGMLVVSISDYYKDKNDDTLGGLIDGLADAKIMLEVMVVWLKSINEDQALWTVMHSKLDQLKEMLRIEEAERDAD